MHPVKWTREKQEWRQRLITRLLESHRHVDGDGHSGPLVCEPETLLEVEFLQHLVSMGY